MGTAQATQRESSSYKYYSIQACSSTLIRYSTSMLKSHGACPKGKNETCILAWTICTCFHGQLVTCFYFTTSVYMCTQICDALPHLLLLTIMMATYWNLKDDVLCASKVSYIPFLISNNFICLFQKPTCDDDDNKQHQLVGTINNGNDQGKFIFRSLVHLTDIFICFQVLTSYNDDK